MQKFYRGLFKSAMVRKQIAAKRRQRQLFLLNEPEFGHFSGKLNFDGTTRVQ